ncbi:MAG: hypothetical protein JNL84_08785 [Candidatus Accumulibacter sp.]|nr:hypothetical protein [Accumulibacter sp.]
MAEGPVQSGCQSARDLQGEHGDEDMRLGPLGLAQDDWADAQEGGLDGTEVALDFL